jgi:signal transduction histidine kinase
LNRLIDKILDLEKFETGKQSINPHTNNLIQTIKNSIKPLQHLIKNKAINVTIISNEKVYCYYDDDRIVQVITNLLSNAIKFCSENNGKITIQCEVENNFVKTCVIDNGKGIDKNDFEAIFDKFYQSINQNIKKPVGSGLGLAICKQIIEHHKGNIWVENTMNGANISFTLPIDSTVEIE